jgi:hypothetical protein
LARVAEQIFEGHTNPFSNGRTIPGMRYQDREWRLLTARLHGVASGYAGRYRKPPVSRQQAIAEIRAVTDDPAVLADTVAEFVTFHTAGWWWTGEAAQILLDAGADPDLVCDYVNVWRAQRAHMFDLGEFADRLDRQGRYSPNVSAAPSAPPTP